MAKAHFIIPALTNDGDTAAYYLLCGFSYSQAKAASTKLESVSCSSCRRTKAFQDALKRGVVDSLDHWRGIGGVSATWVDQKQAITHWGIVRHQTPPNGRNSI